MSTAKTLFRAAALAAVLLSPAAAVLAPSAAQAETERAHQAPDAEAFVQSEANRVIAVLSDRRLGFQQKRQIFRRMIDQVADVPRITEFVLGKYRRSTSPQQQARFGAVFRQYAYGVYESRLNAYAGQRLQVTGSVQREPGDVVVQSRIIGPVNAKTPDVQWRLLRDGSGRWRVVDANINGIWLAITEQQDFVSTLDNNGGNIDALIAQLRGQGSGGR